MSADKIGGHTVNGGFDSPSIAVIDEGYHTHIVYLRSGAQTWNSRTVTAILELGGVGDAHQASFSAS